MSENWTPGPWEVHHHSHVNNEQWLTVLCGAWDITGNEASQPGVVASAKYSAMTDEENRANAHLIAAAPDMYEALSKMLDYFGGIPFTQDSSGVEGVEAKIKLEAYAALAKARGES